MKGHILLPNSFYAPYLSLQDYIIFVKKSSIDLEFEAINTDEINNPTINPYIIVKSTIGDYFIDLSNKKPIVFNYHTRSTDRLYYIRGSQIYGKRRIKPIMAKVAQLL